jgi:hypothetical protein
MRTLNAKSGVREAKIGVIFGCIFGIIESGLYKY